ncbi:hypothetical protein MCOR25_002695 [Pyricularia grisea]|uniref:MAS3 protein n=1 Tax=Pyricularia grisea TaxID=148305 RepID=A0A6P8BC56_PYRGI|nr:uncharacterized protein PgNI_03261 [Pyricularia grisea]KAI6376730.1 hypothetical protein MCOR25_002695 [Pyricularia grisea]TLD13272.1 hypothetical protein PgNI_03261 [Pyricularia grisea]
MSLKSFIAATILAAPLVAGHGAIIKAVGDAGGEGMGLGVVTSTPRDGTRRDPFQQDSTRFKGQQADSFGETVGGGQNDVESMTKAIMAETGTQLPQISPGGSLQMTLHQVNGDGAGPYTCELNSDASGSSWQQIRVTTTPPGRNSRNRDGAMTDFPLVAEIPQRQACTGTVAGQTNVCLVRCMNGARAGPFGGVVAAQLAGSQTPAAARRALAESVKRSELIVSGLKKRGYNVADLSQEEIDELRRDGEIA